MKKDNKLLKKYYGPYKVLQNIGIMTYILELPASSQVHTVHTIFPKLDEEGKIILEPKAVTEKRTRQLRNQSISKYLIKWKNLPIEDSTGEDDNFRQKHQELLKH